MKYFKKLEGEKIYLSPRNTEDVEIFTKWLNDFQITDYTGRSGQIMTLNAEKEYLETSKENVVNLVIVDKENDKMIGTVSLNEINPIRRRATLGIIIGETEYHSKGYGTEAVRLIVEYGFQYLNLNNISLDVMAFNERAIKCYEKCGFKKIGYRRNSEYVNGKYYDRLSMDMLKEEVQKGYIKNTNIS